MHYLSYLPCAPGNLEMLQTGKGSAPEKKTMGVSVALLGRLQLMQLLEFQEGVGYRAEGISGRNATGCFSHLKATHFTGLR